MAPRRALFLHKSEWERINSKDQDNLIHTNEDYIKSLNEQSQKWIKSWPDTEQGHVRLTEKHKQTQRAKNIEFVKKYLSITKIDMDNHQESIKRARELIFQDSCYGRQLLSALLESKTIEERNAQIQFQNKMKEDVKCKEHALPLCNSIESADKMEQKERKKKLKQIEDNLRTKEINKLIIERHEKEKKKEQDEKIQAMTDSIYNEKLKALEDIEKKRNKQNYKKDIKNDLEERQRIKQKRKQQELETLKSIEEIRKYQERIDCKIKAINIEIIKERNNNRTARVYNQLKLLKEEKQSRYDTFINKGLTQHTLEAEQQIKPKLILKKAKDIFDDHKTIQSDLINNPFDKFLCDRQCIISKSSRMRRSTNNNIRKIEPKLLVENSLVEEYKKRQKKPSDWSGLNVAHAQFGTHATALFKECQYKHMARKVVDEYRRVNCLDEKTLPVAKY